MPLAPSILLVQYICYNYIAYIRICCILYHISTITKGCVFFLSPPLPSFPPSPQLRVVGIEPRASHSKDLFVGFFGFFFFFLNLVLEAKHP
jgi:hypothetical protein